MQTPENNLIVVLVTGTAVIFTLIAFLFLLVFVYQRKLKVNHLFLHRLRNEHQAELFNAVFEARQSENKRLTDDLHSNIMRILSAIRFSVLPAHHKAVVKVSKPPGVSLSRQKLMQKRYGKKSDEQKATGISPFTLRLLLNSRKK